MVDFLLLSILYAFLGGAIKYVDEAYDESAFSTFSANGLAVLAGMVMGALMAVDSPFSTAFFAAMLISLFIAKKIDNIAFVAGTVFAIMTVALLSHYYPVTWLAIPIALFLLAGFIDEIGDNFAHKHQLPDWISNILHYRPFSDLALLGVIVMGGFSILYIVPYFAFTFSYIAIKRYAVEDSRLHAGVTAGMSFSREKVDSIVRLLKSMRP